MKTQYADAIDSLDLGHDHRHIEGIMRLEYHVLSGLDRATFDREARIAALAIREMGEAEAEANAQSFGL